jgi:YD repeat-containing protein
MQGAAVVIFGYDSANWRTSLTLASGVTTSYAYDAASRLTGLTYTLNTTTLGTLLYGYDASGNRQVVGGTWARTSLPSLLEAATYNAANRQLTFGTPSHDDWRYHHQLPTRWTQSSPGAGGLVDAEPADRVRGG